MSHECQCVDGAVSHGQLELSRLLVDIQFLFCGPGSIGSGRGVQSSYTQAYLCIAHRKTFTFYDLNQKYVGSNFKLETLTIF